MAEQGIEPKAESVTQTTGPSFSNFSSQGAQSYKVLSIPVLMQQRVAFKHLDGSADSINQSMPLKLNTYLRSLLDWYQNG